MANPKFKIAPVSKGWKGLYYLFSSFHLSGSCRARARLSRWNRGISIHSESNPRDGSSVFQS